MIRGTLQWLWGILGVGLVFGIMAIAVGSHGEPPERHDDRAPAQRDHADRGDDEDRDENDRSLGVQQARRDVERLEARVANLRSALEQAETQLERARERLGTERLFESEIQRALDRIAWSKRMHVRGFVAEQQIETERQNLESIKARRAAWRAQVRPSP